MLLRPNMLGITHGTGGGAAPAADALIPTNANLETHVMPLRMLASEEIATSIVASDDKFAIGSEGKALYTWVLPPTVAGTYPITINILNEITGATRTASVDVEVQTALTRLNYYYAAVAQGTGDGTSAANAALFSGALMQSNVAAAFAAGQPADHLLIDDHGAIVRSSVSLITLPAAGTSEMTRQRIRGVNAAGVPTRTTLSSTRNARPTTNQSLFYIWALTEDCSYLSFEDLTFLNVSCAVSARGRGQALGIQSYHREIEYKRWTVDNCYRLVLHMDTTATVGFIVGHEGVRFWDIDVDYMGHSILKGMNIHRLDARRCTANGRGVNQANNFPAMFDLTASFGSVNPSRYDVCSRLSFTDIEAIDVIDYQASYSQGDGIQADSAKTSEDGIPQGIPGKHEYTESDGTTIADYARVNGLRAKGNTDGGMDHKIAGSSLKRLRIINCKRHDRDWNFDSSRPSRLEEFESYNPRQPATPGTDDGPCHVFLTRSNIVINLSNTGGVAPRIYHRAAGTTVPDGSGETMLGASGTLGIAAQATSNQTVYYDWTRTNVDSTFKPFSRDGIETLTGFILTFPTAFPTPVPTATFLTGFEAGMTPQATATGTDLADLGGNAGAAGVTGLTLHFAIQSDPDDKFEIVGDGIAGYQLRLKNSLSYATKGSHAVTIRATPGIVGANAWNDETDDLTWECFFGNRYTDISVSIAVTGAVEAEYTAWLAANPTLVLPNATRGPAVNAYIRALKDAQDAGLTTNVWAEMDNVHLDVAAWDFASALTVLKGNGAGAIAAGTAGFTTGVAGGFLVSTGASDRILWNRPAVPKYLQNSFFAMCRVNTDVQSANTMLVFANNCNLRPRTTSTQGQVQHGNSGASNFNLPSSGAAGSPIGVWEVQRTSSTASTLVRNGSTVYTGSATSTVPSVTAFAGGYGVQGLWGHIMNGAQLDTTMRVGARAAYAQLLTFLNQGA